MLQHYSPTSQISIQFTLIDAKLQKDTRTISNMNPYVQFSINNETQIKSSICKNGGKTPIWNESHILVSLDKQPIKLQLLDFKTREQPEFIGECQLSIEQQYFKGSLDILYQNKKIGILNCVYTYQSIFPEQYVGPVEQNNKIDPTTYIGPQYQYQ